MKAWVHRLKSEDWIKLALSFAMLFCVLIIGIKAFTGDTDLYWHARTGQDLLRHELSPIFDHYSFTFSGQPIRVQAIFFQITLGLFQIFLGEDRGIWILNCIFLLIPASFLFYQICKKNIPILASVFLITLWGVAISERGFLRPEASAFLLMLGCHLVFKKFHSNINLKTFIWVLLYLVFWSNTHITVIFGFAYVLARLTDLWVAKKINIKILILSGSLTFCVGFLTPFFTHPVLFALKTPADWNSLILEHNPSSWLKWSPYQMISFLTCVGLAINLFLKKNWGSALVLIALATQSLSLEKLLPHTLILSALLSLENLEQSPVIDFLINTQKNIKILLSALIILCAIYLGSEIGARTQKLYRMDLNQAKRNYFPIELMKWVKAHHFEGNVFNEHVLGGYLLYAGAPDLKTFIDGRTNVLYPVSHMVQYHRALMSRAELETIINKYQIRYGLGHLTPPFHATFENLVKSNYFEIEMLLDNDAFLVRTPGRFPIASKLLVRPECINENWKDRVNQELKQAEELGVPPNALSEILILARTYLNSPDRLKSLETIRPSVVFDNSARLASFLSMKEKNYKLGIKYLSRFSEFTTVDLLYLTKALIELKNFDEAQKYIDELLTKYAVHSNPVYLEESIRLYSLIKKMPTEYWTNLNPVWKEALERNQKSIPQGNTNKISTPDTDPCYVSAGAKEGNH